ncbi:MAG TPA: CpaF/VirB11 family protein, partial [Acidimicrobiales bacterium]|nr:CpaF/VirB11 family protein [Acidimicrobiales bacterium]
LAASIPPEERIVTIEQALELGLDKLVDRHPDCVALESRESNIEGEGEILMSRLVRRSLRMNADRVIVGEVLGDEVIPMLNAMSQGRSGSMCTIHSDSSAGVFRRIAAYAAQAPERLSLEAANLLTAGAVDFVVHIDSRYESVEQFSEPWEGHSGYSDDDTQRRGTRLVRRVASVREVVDADGNHVISNEIWKPDMFGAATIGAPLQSATLEELCSVGFTPEMAYSSEGLW